MLSRIRRLLKRRGFAIFNRPNELNILGLRSKYDSQPDELHVFYKAGKRKWHYHVFAAMTTVTRKENTKAFKIQEGQYKNAFRLAGDYLRQTGSITVERNGKTSKGKTYGICLQFSGDDVKGRMPYGSASQFILSKEDWEEFMSLCKKHEELYGEFTYTLVDFKTKSKGKLEGLDKALSFIGSLISFLFGKKQ
jgi:hypothetical protein